jgi:hypothetical protein
MPTSKPSQLKALQFKPGMETLGVVLAFICREKPFSEFSAGKIIAAVKHQLSSGSHICLLDGGRLVAYAGWLPIRKRVGERWMAGEADFAPVPPQEADAAALTIVSVASPALIAPLLRACRRHGAGKTIFFKRHYEDGRTRKFATRISPRTVGP